MTKGTGRENSQGREGREIRRGGRLRLHRCGAGLRVGPVSRSRGQGGRARAPTVRPWPASNEQARMTVGCAAGVDWGAAVAPGTGNYYAPRLLQSAPIAGTGGADAAPCVYAAERAGALGTDPGHPVSHDLGSIGSLLHRRAIRGVHLSLQSLPTFGRHNLPE